MHKEGGRRSPGLVDTRAAQQEVWDMYIKALEMHGPPGKDWIGDKLNRERDDPKGVKSVGNVVTTPSPFRRGRDGASGLDHLCEVAAYG